MKRAKTKTEKETEMEINLPDVLAECRREWRTSLRGRSRDFRGKQKRSESHPTLEPWPKSY
jgi:hypothetical protein